MGLKNIHVLFISMAIALCLAFGTWCVSMYRDQGGIGYVAVAIGSFACALGLVFYGNWFLRKMKGIDSR
jgi:hypothetical protein